MPYWPRIFDAHLHIIDNRFPLVANHGYLPDAFTCDDYIDRMKSYNLAGGAVVSGSFQHCDQAFLVAALQRLGPSFIGVTQISETISDKRILKLNRAGVRGVRFNLKRGGSEGAQHLSRFAQRIHDLVGWHVELYSDSRELDSLYDVLITLPSVSIDHLGLSSQGFPTLCRLAEKGVRVKASGFGRVDFNVRNALVELFAVNPGALMFGTDLPSTRASRPYRDSDFLLVEDALGAENAEKVFYRNAASFYRLENVG